MAWGITKVLQELMAIFYTNINNLKATLESDRCGIFLPMEDRNIYFILSPWVSQQNNHFIKTRWRWKKFTFAEDVQSDDYGYQFLSDKFFSYFLPNFSPQEVAVVIDSPCIFRIFNTGKTNSTRKFRWRACESYVRARWTDILCVTSETSTRSCIFCIFFFYRDIFLQP